jgi:hypothetical protein
MRLDAGDDAIEPSGQPVAGPGHLELDDGRGRVVIARGSELLAADSLGAFGED